ncbi:MAG: FAD-dependent oxidoreductase [Anaerovoracaceae bacterium]
MKTDGLIKELVDSYGDWWKDDEALALGKMTSELYPYNDLFSPITINRLKVKNRIVMAPMGNISMCDETGRPNDKMLQYFFARAKGGTGLLTTGLVPISHGIDNSITEVGKLSYFPRIDRSRTVFAGWRDLAQGVHSYGSRIFIQLSPGLGRVGNPQCVITQKKLPVSASFNPNFYMPQIPCIRLSDRSLDRIIKNTGQASADAKVAGIDGVYLHGHEGYLLEQMTNTAFNRRNIGKYKDPQRFGIDLIKEIRRRVGPDYPIMYRIDLSLALNETYGEAGMDEKALKKFKNGRTIDESYEYMKSLVEAGVDMFDVDLGCYDNWWLPHPPSGMPPGCFLKVSKYVKDRFEADNVLSNAGVPVPVVGVGKLGYPDLAEKALRDKDCDMVMLGRPLLADAEWANKAFAGEIEEIRPCISCQEGCINEFVEGGHPQCAVNPLTGFEDVLESEPKPAVVSKRLAVIGAGPAGVTCALTAAKRGHKVDLYEKSDILLGKIVPGSMPKIKFDLANYTKFLESQVMKSVDAGDINLYKNTEVEIELLKDKGYDGVIFANGGANITPRIKDMDKVRTVQAVDLLMDKSLAEDSERVIVIGGGVVGCETAYFLKYELNKKVAVVEMQPNMMEGVCTANRGHLLHYMKKGHIELFNCSKVIAFVKGGIKIERKTSKNVPNPYNCWTPVLPKNVENPMEKPIGEEAEVRTLRGDLVVLAIGNSAKDSLYFEAQRLNVAKEIYNIGDSFTQGKVLEATKSGYNLAIRL